MIILCIYISNRRWHLEDEKSFIAIVERTTRSRIPPRCRYATLLHFRLCFTLLYFYSILLLSTLLYFYSILLYSTIIQSVLLYFILLYC